IRSPAFPSPALGRGQGEDNLGSPRHRPMNFFAHQDQARRQTRRMLFLFALAVAVIVVACDAVVIFAIGIDSAHHADGGIAWSGITALSVAIVAAIGCGSLYRIATL